MRALMVCKGNICRSPMAEDIFKKKLLDMELEQSISVESAGTESYHVGENYDYRTLSVLKQYDIALSGCSRLFKHEDLAYFDWIFVADDEILQALANKFGYSPEQHPHVKRMTACSSLYFNQPVPDPYYGDRQDLERVFTLLDDSMSALLMSLANNELRGKHV